MHVYSLLKYDQIGNKIWNGIIRQLKFIPLGENIKCGRQSSSFLTQPFSKAYMGAFSLSKTEQMLRLHSLTPTIPERVNLSHN